MAKTASDNKLAKRRLDEYRGQLLDWYDRHGRDLPWRYKNGQTPDPYRVWLSEIMLQQTTVAAVGPYFAKFTSMWPDVHALANAPTEDVMREWAGLGYYARARNLHACAKMLSGEYGGKFPGTREGLRALPGIGDYTSAAIATIVYNAPETVVDGNVERVMARYFAVKEPLPKSKKKLKALAEQFFDNFTGRPGDLAQALMDLGATICIPKAPRCGLCPVAKHCRGRIRGIAETLPAKQGAKPRPQKFGHIYWISNAKGQILLQRRPEKGLLGGMTGLPTSAWGQGRVSSPAFVQSRSIKDLKSKPLSIFHTFTHFDLELSLKTAKSVPGAAENEGFFWADRNSVKAAGFPTVFRKAVTIFLQQP